MSEVDAEPAASATAGQRVGRFSYYRDEDRWVWSDEVAAMHGYRPGEAHPSTALMLSHKHPEDVDEVRRLLEHMRQTGAPFSSRHRIIDTAGAEHHVVVVGDPLADESGEAVGVSGFYVDVTDSHNREVADSVTEVIAGIMGPRAGIEQAKGMLMLAYGITSERAFDILRWRSQETNVKLRDFAAMLIDQVRAGCVLADGPLSRFDHLLLTLGEDPPRGDS